METNRYSVVDTSLKYDYFHVTLTNTLQTVGTGSFSLALMPLTYEYPPTLAAWRPFQWQRNGCFPSYLRLRHHFFLTHLKVIMGEVFSRKPSPYLLKGLLNDMVSSDIF
jgi:hypothetical protein